MHINIALHLHHHITPQQSVNLQQWLTLVRRMQLSAPTGRWSETLQNKCLQQRTRANFLVQRHELLWCCCCSQHFCHMLTREERAQLNRSATTLKPLREITLINALLGDPEQWHSCGCYFNIRLWFTCDPQMFLLCVRKLEDFTEQNHITVYRKTKVSTLCHWNKCGHHRFICAHYCTADRRKTRFKCLWMLTGLLWVTTWKWENTDKPVKPVKVSTDCFLRTWRTDHTKHNTF